MRSARFCWDPEATSEEIERLARGICDDFQLPRESARLLRALVEEQVEDHRAVLARNPQFRKGEDLRELYVCAECGSHCVAEWVTWDVGSGRSDPEGFARRVVRDRGLSHTPDLEREFAFQLRKAAVSAMRSAEGGKRALPVAADGV